MLGRQFDANAAVTGKAARLIEHRFAADLIALTRTVAVHTAEDKIQKGLAGGDFPLQ